MSPVNCLIEHILTILLWMRAEREEDWYMPLWAVENMLRTVSFRHSCAAYKPPKQGFSHISK